MVAQVLADQGIARQIDAISAMVKDCKNALYLGRGIDFPVALEGALKLKEISYIHAEGLPSGEMKHGPIALIDKDMPVFCVVGEGDENDDGDVTSSQSPHVSSSNGHKTKEEKSIYEKVLSNMNEVFTRKGRIITITDRDDPELHRLSVHVIKVPRTLHCLSPVLKIVPLQLIAYQVAVMKGVDPDKPRNLAKSVTVI